MNQSNTSKEHLEAVATYYGQTLQSGSDLRTSACCTAGAVPPPVHAAILKKLHTEVTSRFYGCGSPIPPYVKGKTVLDLGCGTGRDVYLLSGLVGPQGRVIGVDMTPQQLDVARRHQAYHAQALLGSSESNVDLRHGYIEDLTGAGIEASSIDIVVSNCVCNLSPNKKTVFSQVARVLKDGGEFYFSDIYADRRLPKDARKDKELIGECLGGALYINDFVRTIREVGLSDPRILTAAPVQITDKRLKSLVPDVNFYSLTMRIFKLSDGVLEPDWENYGEKATYIGEEPNFVLDSVFTFSRGVEMEVDGNTAEILRHSRYADLFRVDSRGVHRGLFAPQSYVPIISHFLRKALKGGTIASDEVQKTSAETGAGCCKPLAFGNCCGPRSAETSLVSQQGTGRYEP